MRVVIGHGPESSHLAELLPKVTSFYANSLTQGEQRLFLYEFSIDYIFWGPSEKALGNWSPDPHLYQRVIDGDYSVYRVLQQEIG
jgi:hypothetical protein